MLRELPIINHKSKIERRISIDPSNIILIEELTLNKCNIVVLIGDVKFVYTVPKSHKYLHNLVNMSDFDLFMEN